MYAKSCKICQRLKKRKNLYGHIPPKNIAELKPWCLLHVDLIDPYSKYTRQHQSGEAIISNNVSLTCKKMINSATGWFKIIEVTTCDLDEVTGGNGEYIDKPSARVIHLFKNTCLIRYPFPQNLYLTTDMSLNNTSLLC